MVKYINKYRKAINPPYTKKDIPFVILTFLLILTPLFFLLRQTNDHPLSYDSQAEAQLPTPPLDFQSVGTLPKSRSIFTQYPGFDANNNGKKEFITSQPTDNNANTFNFYESDSNSNYSLVYSLTGVNTDYSPSYYPSAIGDADGDGKNELLIYGREGSQSMYVKLFEATTPSDFPSTKAWEITTGWWTVGAAIDDLDNDGKKEIIFGGQDFNNLHKLQILENSGDNSYSKVWETTVPNINTSQCFSLLNDVNGNGKKEILFGGLVSSGAKIHMYESNGDNSYSEIWSSDLLYSDGQIINCKAIADLGDTQGDGAREFAVGGIKTVAQLGNPWYAVYLIVKFTPENGFQQIGEIEKILIDSFGDTTIVSADVDNDGRKEIIRTVENVNNGDNISVFKNQGNYQFNNVWSHTWLRPGTVAQWLDNVGTGDFNNNQKMELLFNEYSSGTVQTKIYESNNGQFVTVTPTPTSTPVSTPTATIIPTSTPIPTSTSTPIPTKTPTPTPDIAAPKVTITNPINGAKVIVKKNVVITADATDDPALYDYNIAKVEFYVNNALRCSSSHNAASGAGNYGCLWTVPTKPNVKYAIEVRAYDKSGNIGKGIINVTSATK